MKVGADPSFGGLWRAKHLEELLEQLEQ